jgi:hypothetical protein
MSKLAIDPETRSVELGTRFWTSKPGQVVGVRFYAGAGSTESVTVRLWSGTGRLLASTTATPKAAGWVETRLPAPVAIAPSTPLTVSYVAPHGHYAVVPGYHQRQRTLGDVLMPVGAGVYHYPTGFPTSTWRNSSYTVEPMFKAAGARPPTDVTAGGGSSSPTAATAISSTSAIPSTPAAPTLTASPQPTSLSPSPTTPPAPNSSATQAQGAPPTGCSSHPSACGYPDASNTGYAHTGVKLDPYTGPMRVTTPGTVIDGKLIKGHLIIDASNVTVKRSRVEFPHADCNGSCNAVQVNMDYSNSVIEDVEVDGNGGACFVGVLIGGSNTARRVDSHDCGDGFRADSGATIVDSYVHNLWRGVVDGVNVDATHNDGIQTTGSSHQVFRHNTLVNTVYSSPYTGVGVNAAIGIGGESGPPSDVSITDNLLSGGGYTVRLDTYATNIRVTNNRIDRSFGYGPFYTNGAQYEWSNNIWDDTGRAFNV